MQNDFFKKDISINNHIIKFKDGIFYETKNDIFMNLKNFLLIFNIKDVIKSCFIINSWLPNKSSIFKSYILNNILLSLTEEESRLNFRIDTYKKFEFFTKKIIKKIPEFYLEDYIPEGNTDEIKYYYNNKSYSVFYGGGYSNLYEYYYLFEIMFIPSKNLFPIEIDPHNSFIETLNYIENIIDITSNYNDKKNFKAGFFEVPSYEYYLSIYQKFKYISNFISNNFFKLNQLEKIKKYTNIDEIVDSFYGENSLPTVIEYKGEKFPLFSRDPIVHIMNFYKNQISKLDQHKFYKNIKLGVSKFIDIRFNKQCLKIVQTISENDSYKKDDLIFDIMFVCDDELFLFFTSEIKDFDILNKKIEAEKKKILENNFTFIDHLEQKQVQIGSSIKKINFYNIYLKISFSMEFIEIDKLNFEIICLNEFIYIFDEIRKLEEFKEFHNYIKREKNMLLTSKLDIFANFKEGHGEILKGAETPDLLMLSSSSSEEFRYKNLKLFWEKAEYIDYGYPKEWDIMVRENGVVDSINNFLKDFNSSIKIGNTKIRVSLIKDHFKNSEASEIGLDLQSIIIEYFIKFKDILEADKFFIENKNIVVKIFPEDLLENPKFKHLLKLKDSDKSWNTDITRLDINEYGIRILFKSKELLKTIVENKTKSFELDFFITILNYFNLEKLQEILSIVEKIKNEPNIIKRVAVESSIPRENIYKKFDIEDNFYIKVRKEMAILLKEKGINSGEYVGKESLDVLSNIRKIITDKLFIEILEYNKSLILFFLERLEELFFYNKMITEHYNEGIYNDNFDKYTNENRKFMFSHKIFTTIIENKLYQNSYGEKNIKEPEAKYIYALTKWLVDIFIAIDSIYNSISEELVLTIEDNMLFSLSNPEYIQRKNDDWFNQMTNMIYNGSDLNGILSKEEMKYFFDKVDEKFQKYYNFTLTNIFEILQALYMYKGNSYLIEKVTEEQIISYLKECYPEINNEYFIKIINYLVLNQVHLGSILSEEKLIEKGFIPYNEINKRPYRLGIKPLIKIEDNIYISRELMNKSFQTYYRHILNGKLPYRNENKEIQDLMDDYAKKIQDKIVYKTVEIAEKIGYDSKFIFREVNLRTFDKEGKHPRLDEIGDYDVLIFDIQKNIVFNIECKYISQDFCAKDLKNTMEQIFGRKGSKRKYYIKQFLKRQKYLSLVATDLVNRKFNNSIDKIIVIPIFLTYTTNIYLKYPPIKSEIIFLTINEFEEYLLSV